jgi:DNA-binding transcriptional LysR family regulator
LIIRSRQERPSIRAILSAASSSGSQRSHGFCGGAVHTYLKKSGVEIVPRFEIDNFAMAISLVASERGVALLPISIEDYLPPSIVSRRLKGDEPTVDLVLGHHRANSSPVLKMFLSRIDGLNSQSGTWGRRTKSRAHSATARSAPARK